MKERLIKWAIRLGNWLATGVFTLLMCWYGDAPTYMVAPTFLLLQILVMVTKLAEGEWVIDDDDDDDPEPDEKPVGKNVHRIADHRRKAA